MPDGFKVATAWVAINPDLGDFAEQLRAKLDEATADGAKVTVSLGDAGITAGLEEIRAQLGELTGATHDVRLAIEDTDSREKLDEIKTELEGIHDKVIEVEVNTGDSAEKLAEVAAEEDAVGRSAGNASAGGGGLSGMFYGIAAAALAAGAALPTLASGLMGIGGVLGAGGLGFLGIHQALSDYMTQQQQGTQAQAQMAGQQAQAAAQAISNAQALASAQNAIVTAQQQVQSSEHSYTDSLFTEQQAQVALTQARIQARLNLQQLNNAVKDSALNERSAQLALEQAEQNQQQVDQNAMSTALQKQEAALAVAQAQQQLTEAQQNVTNSQAAANRANKEGVAGNPQVVAAEHALSEAAYGVAQARQQEANAHRQLALAVSSLAAMQKEQALQARAQQEQMAASSNSVNKFARDMAALTGPQRQLVREFEGLYGVLTKLEQISGAAILPGVTVFVRGLHSMMPEVESAMARFGGVFSQIMRTIGQDLASRQFQSEFHGMVTAALDFVRALSPLNTMFKDLFAAMSRSGGASAGLGKFLADIGTGLGEMMKASAPFLNSFGSILSTLGAALVPIGRLLGQVGGSLIGALAPALKALLPGFQALADALGKGLQVALAAIGPMLVPVAKAISDVVIALAPLLPSLGQLIAQVARALTPVLMALVPVVMDLARLLMADLQGGLLRVVTAIVPLLPLVAQLIVALTPLLDLVIKLAMPLVELAGIISGLLADALAAIIGWVLKVVTAIVDWLDRIVPWKAIVTDFSAFLKSAWQTIASDAEAVWNGITSFFDTFWSGIKTLFQQGVNSLGSIWHGIETVFKVPVNFLIGTVYDKGIAGFWNDVVSHIGLGSLKLPQIATLAGGGRIPGYGGGDQHPALLESGETVVDKDRSRLLAPVFKAAGVPGYAGGGLIGGIGSALSGIGHDLLGGLSKAWDVGRIIAALATGNTTAMTNAVDALVGHKTPAAGDLAQVMTELPKHLFSEAAQHLVSMFSATGAPGGKLPSGSSGAVGLLPANWKAITEFLYANGFTKFAASGVTGNIMAESGGNPEILEIGGGGGGGLIQWTPYPPGYITGNYQRDLMTQLHAILSWGGGPGLVNRATSPSNAALIYQDYYERPASLTASIGERMASANAVYQAMGWGKFDQGGWLPPGAGGYNQTGRPEAVLDPQQSQAFTQFAQAAARSGGAAPNVTFQYFGTQHPTVEQQAEMRRDWALLLGG